MKKNIALGIEIDNDVLSKNDHASFYDPLYCESRGCKKRASVEIGDNKDAIYLCPTHAAIVKLASDIRLDIEELPIVEELP